MQKIAMAVAAAASLGAAATFSPDLRPSSQAVADLGYSLLAGVVLGAGVWPYGASPIPPELQSSLLLRSPDCDTSGHCGTAGPVSATRLEHNPEKACTRADGWGCRFSEKIMLHQ
jgi:hypothetical protein